MFDPVTAFSGFGVGVVVGLTGIGGGALMTPVLLLVLGVAPQVAVGTDLLFASITKVFGVIIHGRHGTVDWGIVKRLSTGSLPAALLTVLLMAWLGASKVSTALMINGIGVALALTALGLAFRQRLHDFGRTLRTGSPETFKRWQPGLTVVAGGIVGVLVALTSVGAGALGTVSLVYLYPYRLKAGKLVGTDLAHAIPLALVAGAGHLALGHVDFELLANLLLGSIPGIVLGSLLSTRAPEHVIRNAIAFVLLLVAGRLLFR